MPDLKHQLSSNGLGLRVTAAKGFNVDADVARSIKAGAVTLANEKRYTVRAVWNY